MTDTSLSRPFSESPAGDLSFVAAIDAIDRATRAMSGEFDLDRILQSIVDSVRVLVRADYAALGIVDARGRIERFITSGLTIEQRASMGPPPHGHGLLGLIISHGRAYRIPDIAAHPASSGFPAGHPTMKTLLGVPIRSGGAPIGNFYLTDKSNAEEFSEQDQRLVELFALHAGIAIQNARLHNRVQRLAVLDERLRIGRDLHDGIIQGLYSVVLSLEDVPELMADAPAEAAERVDRAIDRLASSIGEIRSFIMDLDRDSSETALGSRLAGLADELLLSSGGRMSVEQDLDDLVEVDARLSAEDSSQLLQITREALSNAIRHSGASMARVSLRSSDGDAVLTIEDDGIGFDPSMSPRAGHLGLANLRDRAAAVGAALAIESRPGSGTRIIVRLPLQNLEEGSS